MAIGIMVRRPGGGGIVIDNTYKTLGLSQIVNVSISADVTPSIYTLTVSGENVMVACYSPSLQFSVYTAQHSGSSATINYLFLSPGGLTVQNVRFYVFANPTFGAETYGVKVFDPPTGQCIFSNFKKPIRIAGVVPGNSSFTGTPGRFYAPIILTRYDDTTYNNGVIWNIRYSFLQCGGSTVTPSMVRMRTGPLRRASTSGSYLVADITDY